MINRHIVTIVAFILFILAIVYNSYGNLDKEIFFGILGAIATLYLGTIRVMMENDKFFKELFTEFNSRYDHRINDLFNNLHREYKINKIQDFEISKADENLIVDYINLCSEEYLWYSRNRIPAKVWKAWKQGILSNLSIPVVRDLYLSQTRGDNEFSFYGLVNELKLK